MALAWGVSSLALAGVSQWRLRSWDSTMMLVLLLVSLLLTVMLLSAGPVGRAFAGGALAVAWVYWLVSIGPWGNYFPNLVTKPLFTWVLGVDEAAPTQTTGSPSLTWVPGTPWSTPGGGGPFVSPSTISPFSSPSPVWLWTGNSQPHIPHRAAHLAASLVLGALGGWGAAWLRRRQACSASPSIA